MGSTYQAIAKDELARQQDAWYRLVDDDEGDFYDCVGMTADANVPDFVGDCYRRRIIERTDPEEWPTPGQIGDDLLRFSQLAASGYNATLGKDDAWRKKRVSRKPGIIIPSAAAIEEDRARLEGAPYSLISGVLVKYSPERECYERLGDEAARATALGYSRQLDPDRDVATFVRQLGTVVRRRMEAAGEDPAGEVTLGADESPMRNGIFDYRRGTLRPASPDDRFFGRFAVGIPADEEGHPLEDLPMPRVRVKEGKNGEPVGEVVYERDWRKRLDDSFWDDRPEGDDEYMDYLTLCRQLSTTEQGEFRPEFFHMPDTIVSFCLRPNQDFEKIVINYSRSGSNGKGTLMTLVRTMVGEDNIADVSPEEFASEYNRSTLFGKLANFVDDVDVNAFIKASGRFKSAVTSDPITARDPYGKPYRFLPRFSMMINTNGIIKSADKSEALYRRYAVIEFPARFKNGNHAIKGRFATSPEVAEWVAWYVMTQTPRFYSLAGNEYIEACTESYRTGSSTLEAILDEVFDAAEESHVDALHRDVVHDIVTTIADESETNSRLPGARMQEYIDAFRRVAERHGYVVPTDASGNGMRVQGSRFVSGASLIELARTLAPNIRRGVIGAACKAPCTNDPRYFAIPAPLAELLDKRSRRWAVRSEQWSLYRASGRSSWDVRTAANLDEDLVERGDATDASDGSVPLERASSRRIRSLAERGIQPLRADDWADVASRPFARTSMALLRGLGACLADRGSWPHPPEAGMTDAAGRARERERGLEAARAAAAGTQPLGTEEWLSLAGDTAAPCVYDLMFGASAYVLTPVERKCLRDEGPDAFARAFDPAVPMTGDGPSDKPAGDAGDEKKGAIA